MKFLPFILSLILPLTVLSAAGESSAGQSFLNRLHETAGITSTPERTDKILSLLKAYPARSREIARYFRHELQNTKLSTAQREKALQLLISHPGNPDIYGLFADKFIGHTALIKAARQLLLNIHQTEWDNHTRNAVNHAMRVWIYNFRQHKDLKNDCRFAETLLSRCSKRLPVEQRACILSHLLNFFWFAAYEEFCCAPNFPRWKTLPDTGSKKLYNATLRKLRALEGKLPYPESMHLLSLYNFHQLPGGSRYAMRFSDIRNQEFKDIIAASAFLDKNQALSKKFTLAHNTPLLAIAAAQYTKSAEPLKKFFTPEEAGFITAVNRKDYDTALKLLKPIIRGKKISHPEFLCAAASLLWYRRDRQLINDCAALSRSFSELPPSVANSVGYLLAVGNCQLDYAEELIKKALRTEPANPSFCDSLAYVFYRKKNFSAARECIRIALLNSLPSSTNAPIFLHAAEIELELNGKNSPAFANYLKLARLSAQNDDDEFDYERCKKLEGLLK